MRSIITSRASGFAAILLMIGVAAFSLSAERNIILIVTDDESPTLGCYGDLVARTPHIDALAADGVRFTNAFATTASCSASRSVILSGLHNHKTGQYGHQHHFHKFASYYDLVSLTLPHVLATSGYRTARCGKFHVAPEAVFPFQAVIGGNCRNLVQMVERCRSFLTDADERPFFLYLATCDPHRSGQTDQTSTLERKPDLFGNQPERGSYAGVEEQFFEPTDVPVPNFLPDTPETRAELAQYYQSCSRIDSGLGKLIELLRTNNLYDSTLIVFTSDHGMAFAGAKTTVYDPGLRVPFVVHNPYERQRGQVCEALISHVDITPSLIDFAGALDATVNGPRVWTDPNEYWEGREAERENRSGGNKFRSYHGKSWLHCLVNPRDEHHEAIFASHTFHEIQMYYPMRAIRDKKFKLIWNIAHPLDYPFASDLWAASSWQAQWQAGMHAPYGRKTVEQYIRRPKFELFDIEHDPDESENLADVPSMQETLRLYQARLKQAQELLEDPWISKWDYE